MGHLVDDPVYGARAVGHRPSAIRAAVDRFQSDAMPHLNDLLRTATHTLSDRSKAGDAVQEAYLQVWKSYERFEQGTNCTWLFGILFNFIHHHRRKLFRLTPFVNLLFSENTQAADFKKRQKCQNRYFRRIALYTRGSTKDRGQDFTLSSL